MKKCNEFSEIIALVSNKISEMSTNVNYEVKNYSENNIFYILGIQDFEIRHSNFLAWLLQNDKQFIKEFLTNKRICNLSQESVNNMSLNKQDYVVEREYTKNTNGKSIDLLIDFKKDKFLIVIENKWKSSESKSQLSDYYHIIENSDEFKEYNKCYIYLTLNGVEPKSDFDKTKYKSVSYECVLNILNKMYNKKSKSIEKDIFIKDYIEVLRENTIKVMDRVKEYYKLYEKNKDLMIEMAEYMPNIKERARIEKEILQDIVDLNLDSLKQNTYIWFTQKELVNISLKNHLPQDWLEFCISNEPYNTLSMQFIINKDEDNKYLKFSNEFRKYFNRTDNAKNAKYEVLLTETLASSNSVSGYLTEKEFQEKIREKIYNYFTDSNSTYFKIIEFVKKYFNS